MDRMLHSAKFWTAIVDLVVSLTVYFVTKYVAPQAAEDVLKVLASIQPVILLVIAAWTAEDVAVKWRSTPYEVILAAQEAEGYDADGDLPAERQ